MTKEKEERRLKEKEMRDRNANLKKAPSSFGVSSTPMGGAGSCSSAKSSTEAMEQIATQEFYEKQAQLQMKKDKIDVLKEQLEEAEAAFEEAKRNERQALDAWTPTYYAATMFSKPFLASGTSSAQLKGHGNWDDI